MGDGCDPARWGKENGGRTEDASPRGEAGCAGRQVEELTILVRKLAHSLKKHNKTSDLPERALDYLRRNNLGGSPLRG